MFALALLLACRPEKTPEPALALSPSSGSSAGYETVTADLREAGLSSADVLAVRVGGIATLDLVVVDESTLSFRVQGAPAPGAADVVLSTAAEERTFEGAYTYDPPVDPAFDRLVAIGASLSMGVDSGVITAEGGEANAPALIAQQVGAYLGLPLLVPGLLTPIGLDDIGDDCVFPSYADNASAQITTLLSALQDPETGEGDPRLGRQDPDLEVRNHAVAGTNVAEFLDPSEVGVGETLFGHLINEPDAGLFDTLTQSQLALAQGDAPTVVLLLDLLVNDGVDAVTSGEGLYLDEVSSTTALEEPLEALLEGLAGTGAEVFIGNSPVPSAMPIAAQSAAALLASGATPEEVDALLAEIDAAVRAQNDLLDTLAAAYPNLHVVDYESLVDSLAAIGIDVGDQHLTTEPFGGLVGLDGIHYTHTGYALMANLALQSMRDSMDVEVDDVDLAAVLADDPLSPSAIEAAGLDVSECP